MSDRTCADCEHLDEPPDRLKRVSRQVRFCRKLQAWQLAFMPRGEPDSDFACDKWTQRNDAP